MDAKEQYSEYLKRRFPPKEQFVGRMRDLIGDEVDEFFEICYTKCPSSIRCNTLKISPAELRARLEAYGWDVKIPLKGFDDIMTVSGLKPGELGNTKEHLLGYYYVQEISSMLPALVLQPEAGDYVLDLCASPGSKTTQMAAMMDNKGLIIANELSMGRVGILNSNLERCGVTNAIVTRKEGSALCKRLSSKDWLEFDKILVDAPCSGEGTLRKSPKTFLMWNEKMLENISKIQKRLACSAFELLKVGGDMIYSTCTLAPEENEMVVDYLLKKYGDAIEIGEINLPLKFRSGVSIWKDFVMDSRVERCLRLYPQDNDTDGFFVCKIKKLAEVGDED